MALKFNTVINILNNVDAFKSDQYLDQYAAKNNIDKEDVELLLDVFSNAVSNTDLSCKNKEIKLDLNDEPIHKSDDISSNLFNLSLDYELPNVDKDNEPKNMFDIEDEDTPENFNEQLDEKGRLKVKLW